MQAIEYRKDKELDLDAFIGVYVASGLGERRPVGNREVMRAMLERADLVVSAWAGERLVGLARTLTDFVYVAYLSDLAVDQAWQRQGIGRELIRRTEAELAPDCLVTLLAAPGAREYYGKVGFAQHPSAWVRRLEGK